MLFLFHDLQRSFAADAARINGDVSEGGGKRYIYYDKKYGKGQGQGPICQYLAGPMQCKVVPFIDSSCYYNANLSKYIS